MEHRLQPRAWLLTLVFAACGLVVARAAADTWLLTTADFQTQSLDLSGIDQQGLTVRDGRRIPLDRVLQLEHAGTRAAVAPKFVAHLHNGARFAGEPVAVSGEQLRWNTPALGQTSLPLRDLRAIVRGAAEPPATDAERTEDLVRLANGDVLRGILVDLTAEAVTVQTPDNQTPSVPLDSVSAVEFAVLPGGASPDGQPRRGFRIALTDGSSLTVPTLTMDERSLTVGFGGADRKVPVAAVVSIEQTGGPVVWLSSTAPAEVVQTPFLGPAEPTRMDRTTRGQSIRYADRLFTRGIGVHSYSRLTWPIDPSYRGFRTQYALDGDLPYADVTVRIKVDDRVVHERTGFKAGELSPVVTADLEGGKSLTLEVDYGETYDVQDRFNWIEPAFLRYHPQPATAPATQQK